MPYIDINAMRLAILRAYDGPNWERKVRNMADNQVIAVYYSFLNSGKLNKNQEKSTTIVVESEPYQLSFDDII